MKFPIMPVAALTIGLAASLAWTAADDEKKGEAQAGLLCQIWDIGEEIEDFPDPKAIKPVVTRADKTIDVNVGMDTWPGTELSDYLFIRWTGKIKIPKDGKYTFYLESDDGSRLYVDGKQVISNGGLHGMHEEKGTVELKAGSYDIKIEFFENGGEAGCRFSWSADGIEKQIVPETALSHTK